MMEKKEVNDMSKELVAKNGYIVGSKKYIEKLPNDPNHSYYVLNRDISQGLKNNDFVMDKNVKRLYDFYRGLERIGIKCYTLKNKTHSLDWYTGGDRYQIQKLQRLLNSLHFKGKHGYLTVDGVYGKETLYAWDSFVDRLIKATVPTLTFIDPLQSNITGIKSIPLDDGTSSLRDFSSRFLDPKGKGKGTVIFRADTPHNGANYLHTNTLDANAFKPSVYNANKIQKYFLTKYSKQEINKITYNLLKNFDGYAKKIRVGGKILLVVGIVLDALELGIAIDKDLKDADKKLGKKTILTAASIGGRWVGGLAGAKVGAAVGASIGTAIFPGVRTVIGTTVGGIAGGVGGSYGGDLLAKCVVDITVIER